MRVAFARNLFFPEDFGGNRYPFEVVHRLIARGHELTVITGRSAGDPKRGLDGARFLTFPVSRANPLATHLTNVVCCLPALLRALRGKPQVLVVSSYDVALACLLLRRFWPGLPLLFIYHSEFYSEWAQRLPARLGGGLVRRYMAWVQRTVLSGAHAIVAVSEFSQRQIVASAPAIADRVRVIPTGVDTVSFQAEVPKPEAKARLGLDPAATLLLAVGRLSYVKGFDLLLDALATMKAPPRTIIAGEGPERAALEAQIERLGLADVVTLAGYKPASELSKYMRAADLQVCSSRFENHSLAIVEALACGTPVAGTPTGGTPEILSRVDPRLLFSAASAEAISAGLEALLSDPDLLAELGGRCRQLAAACYDWGHVIDHLEALLQEAAQQSLSA